MHQRLNASPHWLTLLGATLCVTAIGCQSVVLRGQGDANLAPSPEVIHESQLPAARTALGAPSLERVAPHSAVTPYIKSEPISEDAAFGSPPIYGAPSELCKTSLPTYVVEPPDILLIDVLKLIPKPPYRIESFDVLQIVVVGTLLGQDIAGQFAVDPSGTVDLGPAYGKVNLAKQTIDEARQTIDKHLRRILSEPEVSVVLAQSSGMQLITGDHLVGPDGTVNLGNYGSVFVAGMTLAEIKDTLESHLSNYLQNPRVSVDVFAYNSKVFYIVSQGAGLGDGVTRVPMTGNETVLDAVANVNGLSRLSSKKIWIARPMPGNRCCDQVLPVNWKEITAGASSATNYQLLPGDRVFLAEDKFIAVDALITKVTAPFERIFGFTLLTTNVVQQANNFPLGQRGGGF